ncbi:uncharacterized protein LOC136075407 isoform X4 [Hydra vulgaris]|uniref:Uncharacterized protein LOC136075407 isoform X4 n=1 Tax=Hydra vulgaris TaxID=6087 RepID=A0ABM4B6Q0_HYDVU
MLFLTKVCGRYLMNNCAQKDRPNVTEKQDLSKSIIDCFPILHDGQRVAMDTSLIEKRLVESWNTLFVAGVLIAEI